MHVTVRRCTSCGRDDLRERWASIDDAVHARAMSAVWTCPHCAGTEADLVEVSEASASPRAPSAEGGLPAGEHPDPPLPADPDEARRRVETAFPLRR